MSASPHHPMPGRDDPPIGGAHERRPKGEHIEDGRLRLVLLWIVLIGVLGLAVELILLEHYESFWQWSPFIVLGAALLSGVAVLMRPRRTSVRAFRMVMALCVVVGGIGLVLHYRGNVEFERESDPAAHGLDLVWRSLTGATPALAPGALTQIGLVGLAYAFRHPVLRRRRRTRVE
jgi:hypothetical protein